MKRIICALLFLLALSIFPKFTQAEDAYYLNDYTYTVAHGEAVITRYSGYDINLEIPSVINGYPVTAIGDGAFGQCLSLYDVIIPDSVKEIGADAFSICIELSYVTLPDSLVSIGESAFKYCEKLTEVIIPASVIRIGDDAFNDCDGLKDIFVLPENTVYADIDGVLFEKAPKKLCVYPAGKTGESYAVPEGILSVGNGAFSYSKYLTNVTIPESTVSISEGAFAFCQRLESIYISPNNPVYMISGGVLFDRKQKLLHTYPGNKSGQEYVVPKDTSAIGKYAFSSCVNLVSITLPDGIKEIDDYVFKQCSSLTELNIPASVTRIGEQAFYSCDKLTVLVLPDKLESIGSMAFAYCYGLTGLSIPAPVEYIGDGAFIRCTNLTALTVSPDNRVYVNTDGALIDKSRKKLHTYLCAKTEKTYTVPQDIKEIGGYAFYWCDNLTSLIIPDGVTTIGYSALHECKNLSSIRVPASVTVIEDFAIDSYYGLTLEVEEGSYILDYARENSIPYVMRPDWL